MTSRPFGMTADGRTVQAVTLSWPGGIDAEVLTFGAILHSLRLPTPRGPRQVLLNYDRLEEYERDTAYVGALVGRFANRIAGGRFELDGRMVEITANEPPNTLHGGRVGFNKRHWHVESTEERSVVLAYTSPDGEEGFPGAVEVRARFTLTAPDALEIVYEATTDAPTAVNLSQHLYFNLIGRPDTTILDHRLTIAADRFTPVGPGLIPTGEVAPVEGAPFDLRHGARIGEVLGHSNDQLEFGGGLDLNWALNAGAEPALRVEAPDGTWLEVATDQAGMQVYSGQKLTAPFVRHGGLAVEPQGFPDAVNHDAFPSAVLRPGETYRRRSVYRLGL